METILQYFYYFQFVLAAMTLAWGICLLLKDIARNCCIGVMWLVKILNRYSRLFAATNSFWKKCPHQLEVGQSAELKHHLDVISVTDNRYPGFSPSGQSIDKRTSHFHL